MTSSPARFHRVLALLAAIFLAINTVVADNNILKIHELHYQLATSVLPTVDGLLREGETANEYNNQLIVNASAATHRQVEMLLREIDQPSRNLLIHVRNNSSGGMVSNNIGAQGVIRTGEVYLGAGGPIERDSGLIVRKDGMTVQTNREVHNRSTDQSQQLRAIEGHPAWISTGQSIPYRSRDRWGNAVTDYQNADQGFYITARLIGGDRVQLSISTRNDALSENPRDRRRGVIDTQHLDTSVTGAVGEWINLGGISSAQSENDSSYTSRRTGSSNELTDISVRIVPTN